MRSRPKHEPIILMLAFLATGLRLPADTASTTAASTATAAPSSTSAAASPAVPAGPAPWVLGIARFIIASASADGTSSSLQDTIPLLIASDLKSLPSRHTSKDTAAQIASLAELRSRFSLGDDLAKKLDARALGFFDPTLDAGAWRDAISKADQQVSDAEKKLEDEKKPKKTDVPLEPEDLAARLWDGYAKGRLIDAPATGLDQAAKSANVDLLVTGTVAIRDGYATVGVDGYDADLGREVFSWKDFCSVDDPGPLADEFAMRLERWTAGRDFARLDVRLSPASAELVVDGTPFEGNPPILYAYRRKTLHLYASAAGYSPGSMDVALKPGDEKSVDLKLEPLATGSVSLTTSPSEAQISVDSLPFGQSPISIPLDGSRRIVMAQAKGRESQTLVLPASGESDLHIDLRPTDGLGPKGRILAAKDSFYQSLGWFVLSIPVTSLALGVYNGYSQAYVNEYDTTGGDQASLLSAANVSYAFLWAAAAATGVTATFMITHLIKYLASAR